jgi:AcrR family transcriptional regulator
VTNPTVKTRMKSGERREAIIAAAVHLFSEKGFRGATTRELAAALDVTEPVIYQHFETKRDLYRAIIETKARERREDNEYWAEVENPRGDREFFGAVARLLLQRIERDPSYLRLLLFSALEGHELAELFFERDAVEIYNRVSGYIRKRIEEGALRSDINPCNAARALVSMAVHHATVQALFRDTVVTSSREDYARDVIEIFLAGMERR